MGGIVWRSHDPLPKHRTGGGGGGGGSGLISANACAKGTLINWHSHDPVPLMHDEYH